jgi:hypothetical protein
MATATVRCSFEAVSRLNFGMPSGSAGKALVCAEFAAGYYGVLINFYMSVVLEGWPSKLAGDPLKEARGGKDGEARRPVEAGRPARCS